MSKTHHADGGKTSGLVVSLIVVVLAAILLRDTVHETPSVAPWVTANLTEQEVRNVWNLATRIERVHGSLDYASGQLKNDVRQLSIREAAGLAVILLDEHDIDPRPWLPLPHQREQAAIDRVNKLRDRIGHVSYSRFRTFETAVRGPERLRNLCGDEMLTEAVGAGFWVIYEEGVPGPTNLNDDDVETIIALPGLEWVLAEASQLTDRGVAKLASLKRLRELRLSGTDIGDESLRALGRLRDLQILDVTGAERITDEGIAALRNCTSLEHLLLDGTGITSASLPVISRFSNLQELSLSKTQICDRISELQTLQNLTVLRLEQLGTIDTPVPEEELEFLSDLSQLQAISLWGTAVPRVEIESHPKLRSLQIGHELLTDLTLVDLPNLGSLQIYAMWEQPRLELQSFHVEGLPSVRSIQIQGLNRNAADGLAKGLHSMPLVKTVYLNGRITDPIATALGHLEQLELLSFRGSETISPQQLGAIARAPQLDFLILDFDWLSSETLQSLQRAQHLTRLQIDDAEIDGTDFLSGMPNLEFLDLKRCHVTSITLDAVTSLGRLEVDQCEIGSLIVSDCERLTSMSLDRSEVVNLKVESCPQFTSLFCGRMNMLCTVQLSNLPLLERLTIQEDSKPGILQFHELPKLRDVGFWAADIHKGHIGALAGLPSLSRLDISSTNLDDSAAEAISQLVTLKDLSASRGLGIEGLRQISHLPALRDLDLYHTPDSNWTPEQARELFSHVEDVAVFSLSTSVSSIEE